MLFLVFRKIAFNLNHRSSWNAIRGDKSDQFPKNQEEQATMVGLRLEELRRIRLKKLF